MNIIVIWDPSHGVWNDVKVVLKECGFWLFIQLTTIAMNLPYGPWEDARWFECIKAAVVEIKKCTTWKTNKLFLFFFEGMCADLGF